MEQSEIDKVIRNREKDGIYALAVRSKTSDGMDVRTYVSKYLDIGEDQGKFIEATNVIFNSGGYNAGTFARLTDALDNEYILAEETEIPNVEIVFVYRAELRKLLNAKPKLISKHDKYISKFVFVPTTSISEEYMNEVLDEIDSIYSEVSEKQKTLDYNPQKDISFDAYISEVWHKSAATLTPSTNLHRWMETNVPEYLNFLRNNNPKVLVKELNKRSLVIEFPEINTTK